MSKPYIKPTNEPKFLVVFMFHVHSEKILHFGVY